MDRHESNSHPTFPAIPSPPPSGKSGGSSEVVDAEYVEMSQEPDPGSPPTRALVARAVRGSGSRRGSVSKQRAKRAVLARARCSVCGHPAIATARVFSVIHVPLCQRCGSAGALALQLLGGA